MDYTVMKTIDSNTVIAMKTAPAGYIARIWTNVDGLLHAGWRSNGVTELYHEPMKWSVLLGPQGKGWASTPEEAIDLVIKFARDGVKKLEKNNDLRPSQVRLMEFLKDFLTKV